MARFTRSVVLLLLLVPAARTEAFPAFARKYGTSCTACHEAWPKLNAVGMAFRDNGYQFGRGKDAPETRPPEYIPIALRTFAGWEYTRTTNVATDSGPETVQNGAFAHPEVDILTGGTIARDLSFLLVVAGFGAEGLAEVESGWARVSNIGGSSWLNARVGKLELDQPLSNHRSLTFTSGFAAYSMRPADSVVEFDLAENQMGVEIDGHSAGSVTRYSLSVTTSNGDPGSSGFFSTPVVYGHVQRSFEPMASGLTWVRVGLIGAMGWWPTTFLTDGGEPIPGTGTDHKTFQRAGADLSFILGSPATPLSFTLAWLWGKEDAALSNAGVEEQFNGGFGEVDWSPTIDVVVFGRYDFARYRQGGAGDIDGGTAGLRYYWALGPRAALAAHVELHAERVKGGGGADDTQAQVAAVGIDFDY
jgi:hypothetical protein